MAKTIPADQTIGMLAASHAGYREVFEDLGIDYYCAANLGLDDAAQGAGLDPSEVRAAMERVVDQAPGPTWCERPLPELIDAVCRHHAVLRTTVFQTAAFLDQATRMHDDRCIRSLRHDFRLFSEELLRHIEREEVSLFPIASSLDAANTKQEPLAYDHQPLLKTIGELVVAHGTIVAKLDVVSNDLDSFPTTDIDVCRKMPRILESIRRSVHTCLNLENQIVFPRVAMLLDTTANWRTS